MARHGRVKFDNLEKFRDKLEESLTGNQIDLFIEACAKELAARLLAKVIKRTPVGQYPESTGKKGGTLRRGWTTDSTGDSSHDSKQAMYSNLFGGKQRVSKSQINVQKVGDIYVVEIINPVYYASYVEFGHRKRGGKGWVEGKFMLTMSEQELEREAPKVIENKLKKKLGECFK